MGQLVGQDGRTYSLISPRIEPAEVEALVEAGWPVVTYYAGGRLVWRTFTWVGGRLGDLPLHEVQERQGHTQRPG